MLLALCMRVVLFIKIGYGHIIMFLIGGTAHSKPIFTRYLAWALILHGLVLVPLAMRVDICYVDFRISMIMVNMMVTLKVVRVWVDIV